MEPTNERRMPNMMYCDKCKKFMGTYWLFGTDHNAGFKCPECLPEPEIENILRPFDGLKEASDSYVPKGYVQDG